MIIRHTYTLPVKSKWWKLLPPRCCSLKSEGCWKMSCNFTSLKKKNTIRLPSPIFVIVDWEHARLTKSQTFKNLDHFFCSNKLKAHIKDFFNLRNIGGRYKTILITYSQMHHRVPTDLIVIATVVVLCSTLERIYLHH